MVNGKTSPKSLDINVRVKLGRPCHWQTNKKRATLPLRLICLKDILKVRRNFFHSFNIYIASYVKVTQIFNQLILMVHIILILFEISCQEIRFVPILNIRLIVKSDKLSRD